jgi:hypothetical protein
MKQARRRTWVISVIGLVVLATAMLYWLRTRGPAVRWIESINRDLAGVRLTDWRRVYRHSLVPGGIKSAKEFMSRPDPIARRIYNQAQIDPRTISPFESLGGRYYVNYRVGNRVFWTQRRIRIPSGEPLLRAWTRDMDLVLIRQRCGNLLSLYPRTPVQQDERGIALSDIGDEVPEGTVQENVSVENASPLRLLPNLFDLPRSDQSGATTLASLKDAFPSALRENNSFAPGAGPLGGFGGGGGSGPARPLGPVSPGKPDPGTKPPPGPIRPPKPIPVPTPDPIPVGPNTVAPEPSTVATEMVGFLLIIFLAFARSRSATFRPS